jgi:hypothetical protein
MKISDDEKAQRETVVRWDMLDGPATINTFNPTLGAKLKRKGWAVHKTHVGNDGEVRGWWFFVPKTAISIRSATATPRKPPVASSRSTGATAGQSQGPAGQPDAQQA